jgi:hypothetical protein
MLKLLGIAGSHAGKPFSQVARKMTRESEERENDPISKRGLDDSLGKLMMLQDVIRDEQVSKKEGDGKQFRFGGYTDEPPMKQHASPLMNIPSEYTMRDPEALPLGYNELSWMRSYTPVTTTMPLLAADGSGPERKAAAPVKRNIVPAVASQRLNLKPEETLVTRPTIDSLSYPVGNNDIPGVEDNDARASAWQDMLNGINKDKTPYLRYAPIAANAGLAIEALASRPDTLQLGRISAPVVNERMQYRPRDTEYMAGMLRQQANAASRQAIDLSGGNRGIASAMMLASNRSGQDALSRAIHEASIDNLQQRQQVQQFNAGIQQFNASNEMQARQVNLQQQNAEKEYEKKSRAARRNAVRQSLTALAQDAAGVGQEAYLKNLAILMTGYDSKGRYVYGDYLSKEKEKKSKTTK